MGGIGKPILESTAQTPTRKLKGNKLHLVWMGQTKPLVYGSKTHLTSYLTKILYLAVNQESKRKEKSSSFSNQSRLPAGHKHTNKKMSCFQIPCRLRKPRERPHAPENESPCEWTKMKDTFPIWPKGSRLAASKINKSCRDIELDFQSNLGWSLVHHLQTKLSVRRKQQGRRLLIKQEDGTPWGFA